ncbi:MAG: TIGR04211 family SH3 domain-containing protein [Thermodesulfobacteriota bacterium]
MKIEKIKFPILSLLGFCLILLAVPATLYADTRYVSDKLIITMRRGAGNEFMIVKTLTTGTPLKILKEKEKYLKVSTTDGTEGWVLKQYITTDIPKTAVINSLQREIEKLKVNIKRLVSERNTVKKKFGEEQGLRQGDAKTQERKLNKANNQIYSLNKKLKETTNKYKALVKNSGGVIKITNERDRLNKENQRLNGENRELTGKNKSLTKKNTFYWFLAGAGVLFLGWVVGQFSKRKRTLY